MKENESGRSIVEMIGILALVAILTVLAIIGFSKAYHKYKMNVIKEQISTVATNIKNAYSGAGNYNNLDNAFAISLGLIPEEMVRKDDPDDPYAIVNAFGGKIVIMATTSATGETCEATEEKPCDSFVVKVTNLPKKPTLELLVFPWDYLDMFNAKIEDHSKNNQNQN